MKKKLRIQELKIQSFLTELDSSLAKTARGGSDTALTTVVTGPTIAVIYSMAKDQSWFPHDESTDCTKITTTTTVKH